MEDLRQQGLQWFLDNRPDIEASRIKFDCDDCLDTEDCEFAFDPYNGYTEDGTIGESIPLCLK